LAFFSANDPKLRELEAMAGPTLNTFPVNGYLEYWGRSHKSSAFQPVDGAGIVLKSRQSVCRA
jgi:hypothetical protein